VKRFIVFFAMLLLTSATLATDQTACDDIYGHWFDGNRPYVTYDCNEDETQNPRTFTCTYDYKPVPGTECKMSYSGHWDSTNLNFTYSATYVSGTCVPSSWSGTMALSVSCSQMNDSHFYLASQFPMERGTDATHLVCEVPTSETSSTYTSWTVSADGGITRTYAGFTAKLNDTNHTNFNFGGRTTRENLTQLSNTCSPGIPTSILPSGIVSSWSPDDDNNYSVGWLVGTGRADDAVGFQNGGGVYIQNTQHNYSLTLPCTVTTKQEMQINCPNANGDGGTSWPVYETHNITMTVGDGTFDVSRNGTHAGPISWGLTRQDWRFLDDLIFWFPDGYFGPL
jgi:hypothetical protein